MCELSVVLWCIIVCGVCCVRAGLCVGLCAVWCVARLGTRKNPVCRFKTLPCVPEVF